MERSIYEMRRLENKNGFPQDLDTLFVAAGADYRSYEVIRRAIASSVKIDRIVIIYFTERENKIDNEYSARINEYIKFKKYYKIIEIKASIKDPSSCIKNLINNGIKLNVTNKIGIDISCFTNPYVFSLLMFFERIIRISKLNVFYTEPKSYIFDTGLYDSFKSSSGPTVIKELYTGSDSKDKNRLLVILLGFDGDISREIDEEVGPKKTCIVNGFPGYSPKYKDISLLNNEKLVSNQNIDLLYSKANNPFETYNVLDKLVTESENEKYLNIAPIGSKPMALGACLYAIHNPSVRVIYPIPDKYENITTDECWDSWIYEIPLSL